MWNKAKAILLTSNQEVNSLYDYNNKDLLFHYNKDGYNKLEAEKEFTQHYHLYIISEDEIPKGLTDKCVIHNLDNKKIIVNPSYLMVNEKLVIASTNKSFELPQIPQSFIEQYITEYNKGNIISDVLVEYEECYDELKAVNLNIKDYTSDEYHKLTKSSKLKINSDNTINIKTVKDSFSKEEVKTLLLNFNNDKPGIFDCSKWIEQNL